MFLSKIKNVILHYLSHIICANAKIVIKDMQWYLRMNMESNKYLDNIKSYLELHLALCFEV